ncbi:MAG: patatin-like phospholipase family protein [Oscillospiraceae bacterium]|nr:patatin-like phospholipase family protein [Oscillospiraceae bacterium]
MSITSFLDFLNIPKKRVWIAWKKGIFMRGLVLEGGGARGAYQIGVIKSLYENGYSFDGFVGTSIGAINAAMLAQGDFDNALNLWMNISMEQVFHEDELPILKLADIKNFKPKLKQLLKESSKILSRIIHNGGIHTEKMKVFLEQYIDEEKIRKSGKDFGLVAFSLSEYKAYEIMLDDIPNGQLINYIMASSSVPGFHLETIDGNTFIDGGIYNNCPSNLLLKKEYNEILAVRITKIHSLHWIDDPKIKTLIPSEKLGNILLFTSENCASKIELGYKDGLRYIEGLGEVK